MNVEFWNKHQETSLVASKKLLNDSHQQVMEVVQGFSNEALFTKKYFSWTVITHLASSSISATSSHYDWALKKTKNIKNLFDEIK